MNDSAFQEIFFYQNDISVQEHRFDSISSASDHEISAKWGLKFLLILNMYNNPGLEQQWKSRTGIPNLNRGNQLRKIEMYYSGSI